MRQYNPKSETPNHRQKRWKAALTSVTKPTMPPLEVQVRDILGTDWDIDHHPVAAERYIRPIAITIPMNSGSAYNMAIITLMGTPPLGRAMIHSAQSTEEDYFGFLIPEPPIELFSVLDAKEFTALHDFVVATFGMALDCIQPGSTWRSDK